MKKTINIYADFLDKRKDLNKIISSLKRKHNLNLYSTNSKKFKILDFFYSILVIEKRPYLERLKLKLRKINSKNIFYDYSRFLYYSISCLSIGFISNETFQLIFLKKKKLENHNLFISVPKSPSLLLSLSQKTSINHQYIYSWDHYLKIKNLDYPNLITLVWNEKVKNQIQHFHGIKSSNIKIIGSSQFDYLKNINQKNVNIKYEVLVAGSWADNDFIQEEINLLKKLIELGYNKIKFRLYPNLSNNQKNFIYKNISSISDKITIESSEKNKLESLLESNIIFHSGSTIGIEGMLLNKKVVYYKPKDSYAKVFFKKMSFHNNLHHVESFMSYKLTKIVENLNFSKKEIDNENYEIFNKNTKQIFSDCDVIDKINEVYL